MPAITTHETSIPKEEQRLRRLLESKDIVLDEEGGSSDGLY